MIDIQKVRFGYAGSSACVFDEFSLQLKPGKVYGLLGPNGAGKSTLLYMLTGLLRPQSGRVLADGQDVASRKAATLADIYLVPEEFELPPMTLREYVQTHRVFYPRFSDEILQQCLAEFELTAELHVSQLSMGQKKKALMAFALAANTRHLLMDEPTNGLDLEAKRQFRRVIAAHATEERTIVISTHQVHDVEQLIDHVLILGGEHPATSLLLNASTADLMELLSFTCESTLLPEAIHSERTPQGYATISRRQPGEEETPINLELLYAAVQKNQVPGFRPVLPGKDGAEPIGDGIHVPSTMSGRVGGESWKSVASLFRLYWLTERGRWARIFLGITAIFLVKEPILTLLNATIFKNPDYGFLSNLRYVLSFRILFYVICLLLLSGLFARLHRKPTAIAALTLPASNARKFWSRIAYGTVCTFVVAELALLANGILSWMFVAGMDALTGVPFTWDYPRYYFTGNFAWIAYLSSSQPGRWLIVFLVWSLVCAYFASLAILSSLLFRRRSWLYGIGIFLAFYGCMFFVARSSVGEWFRALDSNAEDALALAFLACLTLVNAFIGYRTFCRAHL